MITHYTRLLYWFLNHPRSSALQNVSESTNFYNISRRSLWLFWYWCQFGRTIFTSWGQVKFRFWDIWPSTYWTLLNFRYKHWHLGHFFPIDWGPLNKACRSRCYHPRISYRLWMEKDEPCPQHITDADRENVLMIGLDPKYFVKDNVCTKVCYLWTNFEWSQ